MAKEAPNTPEKCITYRPGTKGMECMEERGVQTRKLVIGLSSIFMTSLPPE
jgi:hypothetical protein